MALTSFAGVALKVMVLVAVAGVFLVEPRASESLLKSTVVVDAFTPDTTSVGAFTGAETTSFAVDYMVVGVISVALTVSPTTSR